MIKISETNTTPEYWEGFNEFWNGFGSLENPYPRGSVAHAEWRSGWRQALQNDRESLDA